MGKREDNVILNKSMNFAVRIVNLYKYLTNNKKEYVLSKQLLRSGTSIGANVREAIEGYSEKDFECKFYIALKEARESEYWLELLKNTEYLTDDEYQSINSDCEEILKIIVSITKTLRKNGTIGTSPKQ